jgi:hypothetical protein
MCVPQLAWTVLKIGVTYGEPLKLTLKHDYNFIVNLIVLPRKRYVTELNMFVLILNSLFDTLFRFSFIIMI